MLYAAEQQHGGAACMRAQVAGGIWADRFGGKAVLGYGVLWWSLATMLTPLAAQSGLIPLLAARALMGIGEGVAMPAMNTLLSRWVLMGWALTREGGGDMTREGGGRGRGLSLVHGMCFSAVQVVPGGGGGPWCPVV